MKERVQLYLRDQKKNIFELEELFKVTVEEVLPIFDISSDDKKEKIIAVEMQRYSSLNDEGYAYEKSCDCLWERERMHERQVLFLVVQLYSTFEQQLLSSIRQELTSLNYIVDRNGHDYNYEASITDNTINDAYKCLELIKQAGNIWWDSDAMEELRLVNNAIKHGMGPSFKRLEKNYTSLIKKSSNLKSESTSFETNWQPHSILLEDVLLVSIDKVEVYKNTLIEFWDPLRADEFYILVDRLKL